MMLIKGAIVHRGSAAGENHLSVKDILVEEGLVTRVESSIEPAPGMEIINASGLIAIPGLVNAHTHSTHGLLRGVPADLPLELWMLQSLLLPLPDDAELSKLVVLAGAAEMIRSGVTAVVDHVRLPNQTEPAGIIPVVEAYQRAGIRAKVAPLVRDLPYVSTLPFDVPSWVKEKLEDGRLSAAKIGSALDEMAGWFKGRPSRVGMMLGPSTPDRCSADLLRKTKELADKHSLGITMHFVESRRSSDSCRKVHGRSAVAVLEDTGLLSPDLNLSLVHAVHIDDPGIDAVAAAGASVVHCPVSNLRLGNGPAPVRRLLDAGVNVALGTDGLGTGGSESMFGPLRMASLLHRNDPDYRKWVTAAEAFRMATLGGAAIVSRGGQSKGLELGARADIVLLDGSSLPLMPLNNLVEQVAYSADSSCVRTVIVDGKAIFLNGKMIAFDEQGLMDEIHSRWRHRIRHLVTFLEEPWPSLFLDEKK